MSAEESLWEESEAELYEHAPCGYLSARPDGLVVKINQTFLGWLGLPRESVVGVRRFQELLTVPGRMFFESHFHPILLAESRVSEIAVDLRLPGGQTLPVLITGILKRDASGAPAVMRLTVFNATERRAYERALLAKNKELDRLNARKNELLGMAAHDLRTPLAAITAYSSLLASVLGPSLDPVHREFIDHIRDMSAFMSDLITDILDVASIESGSLRLDRKPQPLAPLVRRAAGINAVLSSRKGIAIDVELDEGDAHCLIDARKIDQVLNNLLGNAVKFSHAGTRIRISMATDESRVTVSVEDQGQGIPEGELDRIFTPFEKGSSRTTAGEPSTGLGLSIVKRIVTGHGGTIQVKSTVGVGSTFSFTLPRIAPPRPAEAPSAGSPAEGSARPARVLFVDDNALNQKVGKLMLARVGAEAAFASDGREALALVERERFDLVLMDCHMPDVDGYGATAAIRSMERATGRRRLPIIAMPASATEGARSRCLAAGMDDVLEKPFGQEQLAEVLRRWVQERAGE